MSDFECFKVMDWGLEVMSPSSGYFGRISMTVGDVNDGSASGYVFLSFVLNGMSVPENEAIAMNYMGYFSEDAYPITVDLLRSSESFWFCWWVEDGKTHCSLGGGSDREGMQRLRGESIAVRPVPLRETA
jgi:hypothetical protein